MSIVSHDSRYRRAASCIFSVLTLLPLQAVALHSIPAADEVLIREKSFAAQQDKVFAGTSGRELGFRGFNVSGEVKLAESGFKAFKNNEDAQASLSLLKEKTGANLIRYTLAWEGVQPQPGQVDEGYLAAISQQIAIAADLGLYVLLDYHSDLYSRHTFTADSAATGNGAPRWAVSDVYGKDDCGLPCQLTWSAHKLSDSAVRNAIRGFWADHWALNKDLADIELYLPASQQCADIRGGQAGNSVTVGGWSCHGGANQRWHYRQDGTLRSLADTEQCLDVAGAKTAAGTDIQVYQCNGSRAQQFMPDVHGRLHSVLDLNKCLSLNNGNVQLAECLAASQVVGSRQQFMLRDAATHSFLMPQLDFVQSQFVWQLGEMLSYLQAHLTPAQRAMVIGVDPINEPFDGGIGNMSYADWDNEVLWPFYQRVRAEMDQRGWNNTPVFAEPMVFWSSIAGAVAPATGGHHLTYQLGDGFVFNSHFYDQARMGVNDLTVARNGSYFANIDQIRDEARYLNITPFLSEFGMWLDGWGHTDTERVVNATYQGMESSDRVSGKDRYVDFYTPLVSGTQWQWDYYYDNHMELQNGNPQRVLTEDDAWNGENFSVIRDYGQNYNINAELVQRAYPRALQGELLHFSYEGRVPDRAGERMNYHSIRVSLPPLFSEREFLRNTEFSFAAWRGRLSDAPTEIYWPRHLAKEQLTVITDAAIFLPGTLSGVPTQQTNEVVMMSDRGAGSGQRVLVWDDVSADEDSDSLHFALLINGDAGLSSGELADLQAGIRYQLAQGKSPVYLTGSMTHSGYSADKGTAANGFSLINARSGLCLDVAGARSWNGTNVQSYRCNGSNAQRWFYDKNTGYLKSALGNKCLDHGGQLRDNGKAVIWDCVNSDNLRWNLQPDAQGYQLIPRSSDAYALDAYSTENSSDVGLWSRHQGAQQRWKMQF